MIIRNGLRYNNLIPFKHMRVPDLGGALSLPLLHLHLDLCHPRCIARGLLAHQLVLEDLVAAHSGARRQRRPAGGLNHRLGDEPGDHERDADDDHAADGTKKCICGTQEHHPQELPPFASLVRK